MYVAINLVAFHFCHTSVKIMSVGYCSSLPTAAELIMLRLQIETW